MHAALASGGYFGCGCPLSGFFLRGLENVTRGYRAWVKYTFWVDHPSNVLRNVNTAKGTTSILSPVRSGQSIFVRHELFLLNYLNFMLLCLFLRQREGLSEKKNKQYKEIGDLYHI